MTVTVTDVTVHDDRKNECFVVSWVENGLKQTHHLLGMNTIDEAVEDALDYFGGLVRRDQIRVKQPQPQPQPPRS